MTLTYTCECDDTPERKLFIVTSHESEEVLVAYCEDCAELAALDWNGETAKIRPATDNEVRHV